MFECVELHMCNNCANILFYTHLPIRFKYCKLIIIRRLVLSYSNFIPTTFENEHSKNKLEEVVLYVHVRM